MFPTFYLEDFKKNLSYLEDNNLLFSKKNMDFYGSQYSDDLFKLWLAISSHKSKLLVFQHGGGQGTQIKMNFIINMIYQFMINIFLGLD